MCFTPLGIAGAGLSGVGSYLAAQNQANQIKRTMRAQQQAQEAEMLRQRGFRTQAGDAFATTLGGFGAGNQETVLNDATAARTGALAGALPGASEYTSVPGSTPQVVRSAMADRSANTQGGLQRRAGTLGRLGAWDDRAFENSLWLSSGGQRLTDISSLAGGSANVLPIEMRAAANNAYRAPGMLPDLLGLAGMGASYAGLTGMTDWNRVFSNTSQLGPVGSKLAGFF